MSNTKIGELRNLPCKRVQCEEIWSFCYAQDKNVPADKQGQFGYGDVWTWTTLCADTKLICSWKIGTRGASTAYALMHDLERRLANRIQLTEIGFSRKANFPSIPQSVDQPVIRITRQKQDKAQASLTNLPRNAYAYFVEGPLSSDGLHAAVFPFLYSSKAARYRSTSFRSR